MRLVIFMPVTSTWSQEAALRIADAGHEVHVVDFLELGNLIGYINQREDLLRPAIERLRAGVADIHYIHSRFRSRWRYVSCAAELNRICRRCNADFLLTLWGSGWATMSHLSGFRPYAVYVGGGDVIRVSGIQKFISRRAMQAAAVVFANGNHLAERARVFAPAANVIPLYYGVDSERFSPGAHGDGPVHIVCTRGFHQVYNNGYLIEGLAALPAGLPPFRVTFVSSGELIGQVRALAARILPPDLRRNVAFLDGVTADGMVETLRSDDIYVSLSRYDGASISLWEGMACGLFPVVSDIPANQEWVDAAGENGILVPLDQPRVLAEALHRAIVDRPLRERAKAVNRQRVLDRADSRTNMTKLTAILQSILTSRKDR